MSGWLVGRREGVSVWWLTDHRPSSDEPGDSYFGEDEIHPADSIIGRWDASPDRFATRADAHRFGLSGGGWWQLVVSTEGGAMKMAAFWHCRRGRERQQEIDPLCFS